MSDGDVSSQAWYMLLALLTLEYREVFYNASSHMGQVSIVIVLRCMVMI